MYKSTAPSPMEREVEGEVKIDYNTKLTYT